jgi:hypothetical protein
MNMRIPAIELGAVFQPDWDERPIRVLVFDEVETLYDCWWPHNNAWGLSKLPGNASYYRIPTPFLKARAARLRLEPLTPAEFAVHRPDLPLRLCRVRNLQWTAERYPTKQAFLEGIKELSQRRRIDDKQVALAIPAVTLMPFGPKGSAKRGVAVEAQNTVGFSALELLWLAQDLQAPYVKEWDKGVGLYRSGIQRGLPSYYLWGATDRAGYVDPGT